jgi:hypothetical protein
VKEDRRGEDHRSEPVEHAAISSASRDRAALAVCAREELTFDRWTESRSRMRQGFAAIALLHSA